MGAVCRAERRGSRGLVLGMAMAIGLGALWPLATVADDYTWTGAGNDGKWLTATNWSSNHVPTTGDTAIIGSSFTVTVDGNVTVDAVHNLGTLIVDGHSLTAEPYGIGVYTQVTGTLELDRGARVSAPEVYQPIITVDDNRTNAITGNVREWVDDTEIDVAPGGLLTITGNMDVEDGLSSTVTGDVKVNGGIEVEPGCEVTVDGNLTVLGELFLDGPAGYPFPRPGALLTVVENEYYVLRVGSLNIFGDTDAWEATLDINDNYVIVDFENSEDAADIYDDINNQIKQGFNNGAWDGRGGYDPDVVGGIISTRVNREFNVNGKSVTIGALNNDDPDNPGNPFVYGTEAAPLFDGMEVDATSVLVKYTWFGDADLSGVVDSVDYGYFVAGVAEVGDGWLWGDFDYSGGVPDSVDYGWFVFGYTFQDGPLPPPQFSAARALTNAQGPAGAEPIPAVLQRLGIIVPSADELGQIVAQWLSEHANTPDGGYIPPQLQTDGP